MMKISQLTLLMLILVILAAGGCTKREDTAPPPSNRDGVSDGREDRADKPSDGETPPHQPSAPSGKVGRSEFTIQVGIFDRREAADQLSFDLRAQRINNFIQPVGRRWRVCVGRYYSRGRAERTLATLQEKGYAKAVIIAPESE